jgi:hypothetical protein
LLLQLFNGCGRSGYDRTDTFTAKVVRKYEYQSPNNHGTVFRVDIQQPGQRIETVESRDAFRKHDSVTIYANLLVDHWYSFTTHGIRDEKWEMFPNFSYGCKISRTS